MLITRFVTIKIFALMFVLIVAQSNASYAAGDAHYPKQVDWPFDGMFGKFDRQAAQRGLQVYKEVCASCHSLKRVAFRSLADLGFSEEEIKSLAASYTVTDGPDDYGDMFERPATPSDKFVPPYPNENAARAANGGAYPPDLSLIVKARLDGANYMYSVLTGYERKSEDIDMQVGEGMYYNAYFPNKQIRMPNPLMDELVEYQDGTPATVDQMARDVTIFLQWAAEPEMEERKKMGITVLIFLLIITILFYGAKKTTWSRAK